MTTITPQRLRELVQEELQKVSEAVDHKSINDIVNVASKLLSAVEAFKQKAPPSAVNAVTPHLGEMEKILENMVESPGSYVARPKLEPKVVSLKAVKKEGLRESRMGKRVKITGGMPQFVGQTGTIVGQETDGRNKMYRVRLDNPVDIPGVGVVKDDLWQGQYLKPVREAADPGHPNENDPEYAAYANSGPPCDHCGSENTEMQEPVPSMAGYGSDQGMSCKDCGKTSFSGPEMGPPRRLRFGESKQVTEATGGDGLEVVDGSNWQHLEVGNTYKCVMGRDNSMSVFKGWVTPNTVKMTDSENPEEVNLLFSDVADGFDWESYWSDGKYCVGSSSDPLRVEERD